ncbi:MAG TPA: GGDEF domain-containing protein, partial [Kineobactrum sp.]
ARREQKPLTLVLADIDYFKRVNDRYGHVTGDHVLAHFARTLRGCVRQQDTIGRMGGEEFAIIMGGTSVEDARQMMSRVRNTMLEYPLQEGRQQVPVTASFGVAEWQHDGSIEELMMRADAALYQAKDSGRDVVTVAADRERQGMVSPA